MNEQYWGEVKPKEKKNAQPNNEKHISVQDNKIYYYSGVNRDSVVELNKKIGQKVRTNIKRRDQEWNKIE